VDFSHIPKFEILGHDIGCLLLVVQSAVMTLYAMDGPMEGKTIMHRILELLAPSPRQHMDVFTV
jgi:hypothetical protein